MIETYYSIMLKRNGKYLMDAGKTENMLYD